MFFRFINRFLILKKRVFLNVVMLHFLRGITVTSKQFYQLVRSTTIMSSSYKEAIEALNKLQSNDEYIKRAKIKNNQENNMSEMTKFLNRSGISPDKLDKVPIIHIAGTNGKGSTCSYCENILRSHGYKTGFYSSPHLFEVRERIRLNGVPISQEKFAQEFWKIYNRLDKQKSAPYDMPIYFRFLTILALHIFLSEHVDVAILEVGIGGEYDCTNVIRKTLVAGITPLDIDHTTLLGNTMESIAWNKAGIMKPGAQVFTLPQPDVAMKVLRDRSIERHCTLNVIEDFYTDDSNSIIPPHIQRTNASLALSISRAFMNLSHKDNNKNIADTKFDIELAKKLIEEARWPGRYEIIPRENLVFYLDGAHTLDSMQVCADWFLSKASHDNKKRALLFNVTGDRNTKNLLNLLVKCQFTTVIFLPNVGDDNACADMEDKIQTIRHQLERCRNNKEIWDSLNGKSNAHVFSSFAKAVRYLESQQDAQFNVLITGSLHLIGAAMSVLDPTLGGLL